MRDDYLDRSWADNHHRIGIGFDTLIAGFMLSMERLTALQFEAPWEPRPTRRARPTR